MLKKQARNTSKEEPYPINQTNSTSKTSVMRRGELRCNPFPKGKNKKPNRGLRRSLARVSKPVSRVLSRVVIYLGHRLPGASSDQPGNGAGHSMVPLFGLAPGGVYLASRSPGCWCALTAPLHPYPALNSEKRLLYLHNVEVCLYASTIKVTGSVSLS